MRELQPRTLEFLEILNGMEGRNKVEKADKIAALLGVTSDYVRCWMCEGSKKYPRIITQANLDKLKQALLVGFVEANGICSVVNYEGRVIDSFLNISVAKAKYPMNKGIIELETGAKAH